MDGIKYSGRFAEMERLVSDYFRFHIAPVMSKTQAYLTEKQGEEMKAYSTSLGGILSMMASSAQPMNDPYQVLKVTGGWNSKTTENYIEMCKAEITGSEAMQQDLVYMAGQWRDAVVQEIGRKRYDELSERLGGDLAYAYMDYRVEELMIDKLVKERMPKSSADYIIRKAAESSLLGLSQTLNRSPLAEEIEKRGEAAYRPGKIEKDAGWVLGATADTVMLGGVGSWATLAKFVGTDVAISAVADHVESQKPETLSVEQCISKGVFGSERNVFDEFRKEAAQIPDKKNTTIAEANGQLKNKIPVLDFDFMEWTQERGMSFLWPDRPEEEQRKRAERYKDVPLVIAPGQEEAYLRDKARKSGTAEGEATVKSTKESQDMQSNPVLSPLFCFANIQNYFNMSDLNQLIKRLEEKKSALVAFHDKRWPARVGEIAITHFKRNFHDGGWNDNGLTGWKRTRRQEHGGKGAYFNRTPLLSDRNNLYGGFTYKTGSGRVTVENNVEYAPVHNNGGTVQHRITPRMRKYAWRRFFESAGITDSDSPEVRKQKEAAMNDHDRMWKRLALTPKQTSTVHIPQRKFMGQSTELAQKVRDYTEGELLKIIGDI